VSAHVFEAAARRRGIAAAIAAISLVGIGLSLMIPLLAIDLERRGVPGTIIGLQTAVQAVGSIICALNAPRIIAALGPRRVIVVAILVSVATILSFPLIADPNWWFPLRFVLGAMLTLLFVVSEYWITGVAEASKRGVVMGIYATFLSLGFAAGPAILAQTGSVGMTPYLAGAGVFLLGLLPVLSGVGALPESEGQEGSPGVLAIVFATPVAVLAGLAFGAVESSAFSFLPIWGLRVGLPEAQAALLLSASGLGNVALQIPIGLLADRMDKRLLLLILAVATGVGGLLAPLVAGSTPGMAALLFLWGGVAAGLYTVGLAHLAAGHTSRTLAAANAAFVMNYSLGMLVGPPAAGAALDAWNPHGFPVALAVFAFAYAALVATSLARGR
jgi:MFS family permease